MDKKIFKDAYDIGENMAALSGEGKSFTIINKETGNARLLVNEGGALLVADNEIDFGAIKKGCPDFNGCKTVEYWFGRYSNLRMVFVLSVGLYIQMDVTLQMKKASAWKVIMKEWSIASSIKIWKSSCHSNRWLMSKKC